MDELLKKINPDFNQLKRFVINSTARELSALSEPCYYPKTKKIYFEFLNLLKISDADFKKFVKRNYKGTKAEKWNLPTDVGSNIFIVVMHLFLNKRDVTAYSTLMVYYMLFHYSKRMHMQIKYCDADTFKYTLDNLTKTHLFYREKTITNSLYYLSKQVQRTYTNDIKEWNVDGIISFIQVSRHRINQSIRSFAESYYRYKKEGVKITTQKEYTDDESNVYQYQVQQKGQKIINLLIKKLTVYKTVDTKVLNEAINISKIKKDIATLIVNELNKDIYVNDIKIALNLFLKEVKNVDMICGKEFYFNVKKLMAVKRSIAQIYFKSQINILLKKIITNIDMVDTYSKYTPQAQFIVNSFLAYYLTLYIKNNIC